MGRLHVSVLYEMKDVYMSLIKYMHSFQNLYSMPAVRGFAAGALFSNVSVDDSTIGV